MRTLPGIALTALALALPAVPAGAEPLLGLSRQNELVFFDGATPDATTLRAITGLAGGEQLIGIDLRPADGRVYGVSNFNQVYTLNLATGAVSLVSTLSSPTVGLAYGFDFNPVADRLRVVSDTGQNLRINVDTGQVIVDGTLAYASGDPNFGQAPQVTGGAYTNSVAGAMSTTLYDIDTRLGVLATQLPPNDGTLNTVGPLGLATTTLVEFDISGFSGIAYASMIPFGTDQSMLYRVDLATGAATLVGLIGADGSELQLRGLTVLPVPEPSSVVLMGLGLVGLAVAARRARPGRAG